MITAYIINREGESRIQCKHAVPFDLQVSQGTAERVEKVRAVREGIILQIGIKFTTLRRGTQTNNLQ